MRLFVKTTARRQTWQTLAQRLIAEVNTSIYIEIHWFYRKKNCFMF